MAEIYHLDAIIRDDMTQTEEMEILHDIVKAVNRMAGLSLVRGKHTAASPAVQAIFASAANLEQACNAWGGPSPLAVPQMVMGQRPS